MNWHNFGRLVHAATSFTSIAWSQLPFNVFESYPGIGNLAMVGGRILKRASGEVMSDSESVRTIGGDQLEVTVWPASGKPPGLCPVTATAGHAVKQVTLGNHIRPEHWHWAWRDGFFFCPEPACRVVYYNNLAGVYFTQEEIRTQVGIKSGPPPTPVCYCMNMTEEDIMEEIHVKRCCDSLEDIKEYTRARTGKLCHITNPAGRCCGRHVTSVVERALARTPDKQVESQARNICCQIPEA